MTSNIESLEATYVSNFKCDGKKCNSKCCRNWLISIDDATLTKYKNIKPKSNANKITKHIKKMKEFNNLNVIELKDDQSCPFIEENLLCYIQRNYGEGYLSNTCASYPRLNFLAGDSFLLRSLTLSCPVACNLILNEKRPVKFHTVKIKALRYLLWVSIKYKSLKR